MAPKNVLMALDHGPVSEHAFQWGLKNLVNKEDHITLIHVYSLEPINFYGRRSLESALGERCRTLDASVGLLRYIVRSPIGFLSPRFHQLC
jgi:hypothetical protein